ncbi:MULTISPECIES: cupin domain-containing protein [unclassified Pseudomonas]|uniref:cupin domain-containing protein n=1 Tax=unclassified Pseudomonas TaxID=196821 RepID=UPI00215E02B9|nr:MULTISPECIES: cupin domain-containing protein [unclassified Pseudomonas]UVM53095.1 cupin domain-containing protein [Pseudomonas sp. B21-015]WPN55358.1 cupin domain-containing protein [Pseudomonas sp. P9_31]
MTKEGLDTHRPDALAVVAALNLEPHMEGGFYRRTFQADHRAMVETEGGRRYLLTSIYYLLTRDSPIGHFHLNQSDIVHYYHLGDPIQYSLISPDGTLKTVVMGSDVIAGQCLQLHVPGGVWKASQLMDGSAGYGLISEAVSPGFDYADMELGTRRKLGESFPEHSQLFEKLTQDQGAEMIP